MGTAAKPTRENRTITVDFRDEATYLMRLAMEARQARNNGGFPAHNH
jgi:hypothetical protein